MADPKYENLPGIAYDQPDVYESGDLPEADQLDNIEEEENECIEQLHLSVKDSFNKFKGKLVSENVDFSDRLSRRIRTGYRCGEWELAGQGENETVNEKYQRLKCEISELLEQVVAQQTETSENEKDDLKKLAGQISSTKQALEELKLDESDIADPKAAKLRQLILQAETLNAAATNKEVAHIKIRPESMNLAQTTRLAQLEHRLHKLEAAAGVRDEDAFRRLQAITGEPTICRAAATLAARASLLRPSDLAAAESRITSLLANVDAIKAAAGPANPERDTKINELYTMLKEVEGVSHTEILERMKALESLHNQASDFGKSLSELEALQSTIANGVQNNKALLQGVQDIFAQNIDQIQKEVKKLDDRITKLAAA